VLYRELIRSGVSEYIVLPATAQQIVTAITDLFAAEGAAPIGRTIGFVSAKGGAGGSTVAHNVAWAISQTLRQDVLILDMDLAFGTAGLNFNQDPPHGLNDALTANQKMDQVMLDRLMSKAANHVNLLTAPVSLDQTYDHAERDFEQVVELSQKVMPLVILDIPHLWDSWVRHTLATIDEIVIVAEPDLANLRNAKNLADTIKALRPAEAEPLLVINKAGVPRRPEISAAEFASSVECRLIGQVPFDAALFGTAANNGQMIAEVSANNRINDVYRQIGMQVTGRAAPEAAGKAASLKFTSLFNKRKRA
jgi:pilus assembly protein CpaE